MCGVGRIFIVLTWCICCCAVVSASSNEAASTMPPNFLVGAATAAYSIEGGWDEDGKRDSIWDYMVHTRPETVCDKTNGDVACNSYHKYKEDVKLLKDIGFNVYCFSISWSRILSEGDTHWVNSKGIMYYNNLINELLYYNITPLVKLYHWDLPQRLQDMGGWTNPIMVNFFEGYAKLCFANFGDRAKVRGKCTYWGNRDRGYVDHAAIKTSGEISWKGKFVICSEKGLAAALINIFRTVKWWITIAEPYEIGRGYSEKAYAPYLSLSGVGDYLVGHTLLLAHAKAYRLYDSEYRAKQKGKVGISLNSMFYLPEIKNNTEHMVAAERAMQFELGWFAHPIFSDAGDYPPVMRHTVDFNSLRENRIQSRLPKFSQQEIKALKGSADFLGLTYYSSRLVNPKTQYGTIPSWERDLDVDRKVDPKWRLGEDFWFKAFPKGIRGILNWIRMSYKNVPVIITATGFCPRTDDMQDLDRTWYFRSHLKEVFKAVNEDKCNVFGFCAWTLMDSFQWLEGHYIRYGLHYIDFKDPHKTRIPKMSAKFFQKLMKDGKIPPSNTDYGVKASQLTPGL